MSRDMWADVRKFAIYGGSPVFQQEDVKTLALCYKLVDEEVVKEFLPALLKYSQSRSIEHLTEAVDGAIDSIYVLIFFLNQMGIDGKKMWDMVQAANMAKFPDGKALRHPETGKVMKPEGWKGPEEAIHKELIEWNTWQRGESYKGGLIQNQVERDSSTDLNKPDTYTND